MSDYREPMSRLRRIVASGRGLALLVLASALVRILILRAFRVRTGLPLFQENYAKDRLPPVTLAEREQMSRFSRCIACGLCDEGEAERQRASNGQYRGVMQFVLASSRNMPDFDAASRTLDWVPIEVLAAKERHCPAFVPISDIARFVRSKTAAMGAPS